MNLIYLLIGLGIGYWLGKRKVQSEKGEKGEGETEKTEPLIEKQAREKAENLRKVLEMFDAREKVTNNDIEKALGVSDATATNYLEELERQGKIRQVGTTGQSVYYELKR